jgi:hypothetical protein
MGMVSLETYGRIHVLQRSGTGQESFLLSAMLILFRSQSHTTCRGSVGFVKGNIFTNAFRLFDSPANAFSGVLCTGIYGVSNTPNDRYIHVYANCHRTPNALCNVTPEFIVKGVSFGVIGQITKRLISRRPDFH